MPKKVIVKRNEIDPEPVEVIAEHIAYIADAMKSINTTRVGRRVIALLIHDKTSIGMGNIFSVLEAMETLEKDWLKPKKL